MSLSLMLDVEVPPAKTPRLIKKSRIKLQPKSPSKLLPNPSPSSKRQLKHCNSLPTSALHSFRLIVRSCNATRLNADLDWPAIRRSITFTFHFLSTCNSASASL